MKMTHATRARNLILSYLRKVEKQQKEKGESCSVNGNFDDVDVMLGDVSDFYTKVSEDIANDTKTIDLQEYQTSAFEAGIKLGKKLQAHSELKIFYVNLSGPDHEDIESLCSDYFLAYFIEKSAINVYKRIENYLGQPCVGE